MFTYKGSNKIEVKWESFISGNLSHRNLPVSIVDGQCQAESIIVGRAPLLEMAAVDPIVSLNNIRSAGATIECSVCSLKPDRKLRRICPGRTEEDVTDDIARSGKIASTEYT
jgi:hypothetical protein